MEIIKPQALKIGDTIGIVSPSSSIKAFPRRFQRGVESLERSGFRVKIGRFALESFGHNAGTPEQRADDINRFFLDEQVSGIICTTGGWNANAVLPLIDYGAVKNHPKVFCGFSDITAVNLALYAKTGLVTFNGPTVLPSFGEFHGIDPFTLEFFLKAVSQKVPVGKIPVPDGTTSEILWWEKEDNRPRSKISATPQKFLIKTEIRRGRLVGGNLITLCILGGTEYMPNFTDSIIFLEEEGESTSSVERRLHYLAQMGILQKIRGLVFGRPSNFRTDDPSRTLEDILSDFGQRFRFPVVANADIGHTSPFVTMPIGIMAEIDSENESVNIIESAVR